MTYLLYMKRSFTRSPRRHAVLFAVLTCAFLLPLLISIYRDSNVFNTISTNISLRRREFAMLKSVGMTQKGFRWMMNYECLLYGSKALLLGLPVSCGITQDTPSPTEYAGQTHPCSLSAKSIDSVRYCDRPLEFFETVRKLLRTQSWVSPPSAIWVII